MSTPVQHISATDRPSLDAWPHAVMAALALLITLISAHLVRLTWFDAPASQPLNQPAVWLALVPTTQQEHEWAVERCDSHLR